MKVGGIELNEANERLRETVAHALRKVISAERTKDPTMSHVSLEKLADGLAGTTHHGHKFPKLSQMKKNL